MNIKRTLKRLIDDTQYVAALEKQNDLLKENLQQEKDNLQKQKEDFRKESIEKEKPFSVNLVSCRRRGTVQET